VIEQAFLSENGIRPTGREIVLGLGPVDIFLRLLLQLGPTDRGRAMGIA
jgi:hypothetical protein